MDAHIKHGHYLYKSTKSKVAADTLNSVIPNVVIKAQKPRPPAGGGKVLWRATNKEEGILCLKPFYFQTEDAFHPKDPVSAKPGLFLSSGSCKATLVKSKTEDI